MSGNLKILYFSLVQHSGIANGGTIACRANLAHLTAVPGVQVHAAIPVALGDMEHNRVLLAELGAVFHPIEIANGLVPAPSLMSWNSTNWAPVPWEAWSRFQAQIDTCAAILLRSLSPDLIIVDHLYSALSVPSLIDADVPRAIIIHNNETQHFRDQIALGVIPTGCATTSHAISRLDRFERSAYRSFDTIMALSKKDVPVGLGQTSPIRQVTPCLPADASGWRFTGNRRLFYVGNIGHHPNRLAMEWLTSAFAPRLAERMPEAVIELIGAEATDFPASKATNVLFRGVGSDALVKSLFREAGLLIAPVKNEVGTKMKILEALAHGTPLLASPGALSGLPANLSAPGLPVLRLDDPDGAASLAANILSNEPQATALSRDVSRLQTQLETDTVLTWQAIVEELAGKPPHSRRSIRDLLLGAVAGEPLAMRRFVRRIWQRTPHDPRSIDLLTQPPNFIETSGLHMLERVSRTLFRWTDGNMRLKISPPVEFGACRLEIGFLSSSPLGDIQYEVLRNGALIGQYRLKDKPSCTVELLADDRANTFLIEVRSPSMNPPGDARALSMKLCAARLIR